MRRFGERRGRIGEREAESVTWERKVGSVKQETKVVTAEVAKAEGLAPVAGRGSDGKQAAWRTAGRAARVSAD
jgi:hypothetical protein